MFSLIYLTYLLLIFWMIRAVKQVLFWIYLWQLKEYHVGRFVDHFRTYKGKKLIFDPPNFIKILLLPLILWNVLFAWVLLALYVAQALPFGWHIVKRTTKKPKFTFKTILLTLASFALAAGYGFVAYKYLQTPKFIPALLLFDIFAPIIISVVVLIFQPFFVMMRTRILKKAAAKVASYKNLKVIGITGSYGKTATKEFLATILSSKFNVLCTPEHKNSEIGIAQTILSDDFDDMFDHQTRAPFEKGARPSTKNGASVFIVEMGSYNKGGIKLLCDMVKPRVGMVTGVNQQHLATFGSMENLLSAEGGVELVKALPKNGTIIVNGDNQYCVDLYKKVYQLADGGVEKKIYTVEKNKLNADIWTEDVVILEDQILFIARSVAGELAHFDVNVLGRQQVQNLLGAILAAKEFGMTFGEIAQACKNIKPQQAGMTMNVGAHGINVIDASYSSNPDGVMADLDYLSVFKGRKVIVMSCLIELGNASAKVHQHIGKKIAEVCDLAIITTKDQFESLKKGAVENGLPSENIIFQDKPKEIFAHITTLCKEGDVVLLEGGRPKELIKLLNAR